MTLGEQRRKALELLAPPPSRHVEQAFHLRHVLPKSEHKLCKTPANQGTLTLVPFELILGRTSLERLGHASTALRSSSGARRMSCPSSSRRSNAHRITSSPCRRRRSRSNTAREAIGEVIAPRGVQGDAGGDLCDFQTLVIDKSYLPIDEFIAIYAVNKPQQ